MIEWWEHATQKEYWTKKASMFSNAQNYQVHGEYCMRCEAGAGLVKMKIKIKIWIGSRLRGCTRKDWGGGGGCKRQFKHHNLRCGG